MSNKLSIGYLTGSAKVIENYLNSDLIVSRERRSIGQMFFQPYESKEEFVYCARHTFMPMVFVGLAIFNPSILVTVPIIISGLAITCAAIAGINELFGNEDGSAFFLEIAEYLINDLCQAIIDLVLLPLTAIAMLTRGISTGLHAVGVTEDAPEEVLSPSLSA